MVTNIRNVFEASFISVASDKNLPFQRESESPTTKEVIFPFFALMEGSPKPSLTEYHYVVRWIVLIQCWGTRLFIFCIILFEAVISLCQICPSTKWS